MSVGDVLTEPKTKVVFNAPFITDQYSWVRLTNGDTTARVGYRIKAEDPMRLGAKPLNGLLNPSQFVDVRIDYRKFMWDPAQKLQDRLTIEWAKVPDGVNEFNNAWFDKCDMTRRVYLPVHHNV